MMGKTVHQLYAGRELQDICSVRAASFFFGSLSFSVAEKTAPDEPSVFPGKGSSVREDFRSRRDGFTGRIDFGRSEGAGGSLAKMFSMNPLPVHVTTPPPHEPQKEECVH